MKKKIPIILLIILSLSIIFNNISTVKAVDTNNDVGISSNDNNTDINTNNNDDEIDIKKWANDNKEEEKNKDDKNIIDNLISEKGFVVFITLGAIVSTIILYIFFKALVGAIYSKFSRKKERKVRYRELEDDPKLKVIGNELEIKRFKRDIFNIFNDFLTSYSNDNLDYVEIYLTKELFDEYKNKIFSYRSGNRRNVIDDITYLDCKIIDIIPNDEAYYIDLLLRINCKDYVIDTKDFSVKMGNTNIIKDYTYKIRILYNRNSEDKYIIIKIESYDKSDKKRFL